MTREQARIKRADLLAQARKAEATKDSFGLSVAVRCRTMAQNLELMASDDPATRAHGQLMYDNMLIRLPHTNAETY